jgi:hypothetical protein
MDRLIIVFVNALPIVRHTNVLIYIYCVYTYLDMNLHFVDYYTLVIECMVELYDYDRVV